MPVLRFLFGRLLPVLLKFAGGMLVLVLLLEGGTRLVKFGPSLGDAEETSRTKVQYVLHPYFQNANAPARVKQADATSLGPFLAGWRIHPLGQQVATTGKRILFLGGSTTANDYPARVREQLEAELGPVTVYNVAAPWHCSLHSLYKFWTYVDQLRPHAVVVLHNVNDLYRGFTPPTMALPQYRDDYSHHSGALSQFWGTAISKHARTAVFGAIPYHGFGRSDPSLQGLWNTILAESEFVELVAGKEFRLKAAQAARTLPTGVPYPPDADPDDPASLLRALPAFRRNMNNLAFASQVKERPILFLTMPYTTQVKRKFLSRGAGFFTNDGEHFVSPQGFERGMRAFNGAIREMAELPAVRLVDLEPEITDPSHFVDEVHLLDPGRAIQAQRVAEALLAVLRP